MWRDLRDVPRGEELSDGAMRGGLRGQSVRRNGDAVRLSDGLWHLCRLLRWECMPVRDAEHAVREEWGELRIVRYRAELPGWPMPSNVRGRVV